jgi:hypothetical protein
VKFQVLPKDEKHPEFFYKKPGNSQINIEAFFTVYGTRNVDSMPFCPMCGTKAEPGQSFCENCGSPLQEPAQPTVSPQVPQGSPPPDTPSSPEVYSPSAPPSKEPVSPQPSSGFKKYKLPIIAIACILVIVVVFLAMPKGSPQPVIPTIPAITYSTPIPSPSLALQVYTTRPSTSLTTPPTVSSQVSGGPLSTTEYSSSSRAQFRANRTAGPAPLTVSFYDLTLGGPVKWVWDFGDTSGSSERNPVHTYKSPGKYTVTMNTVISGSMYSNSMDITVTGN